MLKGGQHICSGGEKVIQKEDDGRAPEGNNCCLCTRKLTTTC